MTKAIARVTFTLAIALVFFQPSIGNELLAQNVRGTVKSKATGETLQSVSILAQTLDGKDMGNTTSDDDGKFLLRLKSIAMPVILTMKRIGLKPSNTDPITLSRSDTIEYEFLLDEVATFTDTMRVTALLSPNARKLAEAERRGWKVFTPAQIALHRDKSNTLNDLVRSLGYPGLIVPSRMNDCFRSTRNNNCLEIILDGQPAGPTVAINPGDIYFMAYVSPTESAFQWGRHAPNGAIAIFTRMYGDRNR